VGNLVQINNIPALFAALLVAKVAIIPQPAKQREEDVYTAAARQAPPALVATALALHWHCKRGQRLASHGRSPRRKQLLNGLETEQFFLLRFHAALGQRSDASS
jgi:hypothetical protein